MKLHLPAGSAAAGDDPLLVTPESAGWQRCGLRIVRLAPGASRVLASGGDELAVLPLSGGGCTVEVEGRRFELTGRESVFARVSDWAYVPIDAELRLSSAAGCELALASSRATRRFDPAYVEAGDVPVELRGAGQATRQLNNFMVPEVFDGADRLICCEVLTPDGNWSSYPPHKHDATPECEVDNEEIYYFRVGRLGLGRVLARRLRRAPHLHRRPLDRRDGDRARRRCRSSCPAGYHGPCIAAPGYPLYYLNVMASDAGPRKLAFVDDAPHHWIRATWDGMALDPRLPMTSAAGVVEACDEDRPAHDGAGDRALPDRPAHGRRRRGAAAARGRVRHLRPRQRDLPGRGAVRRARRAPDLPRPERAGHGAGGDRLREGDAAPPVHGRHLLGRPGRHEHGHGGRGRARQPAAAAAARRRHVPLAHPRPGAAAGRARRRAVGHRQRRLPAGHALLGPHHAPGAGRAVAAARDRHPGRSGRLRPGLPRPAAGRPGRGLRLPGAAVRARRARAAPAAPRPPRAGRRRRGAARGQGAADRGRRRRALRARGGAAAQLRRAARRARRRDDGGQVDARRRSPAVRRADRRDRRPAGQRAGRAGRCRARRRHAAAGLHDRLVDGLRQRGSAHHRPQRGALRRRQAPQPAARRRCARGPRGARLGARRLGGAAGLARGGPPAERRLPRARAGGGRAAPGRERAVVRAGHRGRQQRGRPGGLRRLGRRRLPRRAQRQLALARRRHVRLRVRLLVHGLRARGRLGRAHGARAARCSRSSATART